MILAYIHKFKCYLVSSYVDIPYCVPLCSRHDIIDWDSLLSGPLILCSLASQATLFGTCTLQPAGLISMSGMVSLVTSDLDFDYHSLHLSFVSEDSYLLEPIWSTTFHTLSRLCSNLTVSLLGHQIRWCFTSWFIYDLVILFRVSKCVWHLIS